MLGLFVENGPCYVHSDSNSTYLSEYSWNNEVNMLFLDQPVQVGLSYDSLQNITNNLVTGDVEILDETSPSRTPRSCSVHTQAKTVTRQL
jgi:carboxypeptidase C (cathepsin A)